MNRVLVPRGLRLVPLRREKGRALLYLFRPAALSRDLAQEEVRRLLRQAGYRDLGQGACLAELRRRLGAGGDFPHEIGLFLGYPPEDVAGFVRHRGKGCKCVGCWKVYGDEAAARRQFAAFKACTANYCRRGANGAPGAGGAGPPRRPKNPAPSRGGACRREFLRLDRPLVH